MHRRDAADDALRGRVGTGSRGNMRQQNGRAVADAIQKPRREQINAELNAEIDRDEQRDFRKRDLVRPLEHDEQQRHEIVDDRLCDVTDIAGGNGVSKISFNTHN